MLFYATLAILSFSWRDRFSFICCAGSVGAGGASVGGTDNNNNDDDDDEEEKEEEDDDDVDENNLSISTCYNKDIHYMTLFITCTWNTYSKKN